MSKYYYLVAQLPSLIFGHKPTINRQEFMEQAAKWLSGKEFIELQALSLSMSEPGDVTGVLKEYKEFDSKLRSELAHWRKTLKSGSEYKIQSQLASVVLEPDPLEAEKKILHTYWRHIEELETGKFFNLDCLKLYALKLSILERFFMFDKEKGAKVFEKLSGVNPFRV